MKEEVQKIIQTFSKSKAGYIKVTVGGEMIELSKAPANNLSHHTKASSPNPIPRDMTYEVHSKNVGRYHAPEISLAENKKISLKDSLGYIESMGLKHDIPFSKIGFIKHIYVHHGDVVEFGQLLFIIQEEA